MCVSKMDNMSQRGQLFKAHLQMENDQIQSGKFTGSVLQFHGRIMFGSCDHGRIMVESAAHWN